MDCVERVKLFSTKIGASGTHLDFPLGFYRLRLRPQRVEFLHRYAELGTGGDTLLGWL
ncbi:hypothetical protein [Microcoleus asticus]|uniref:hypothetical protein n=1 Tax=Microcoleus asticus TaxID=2815231 RepID=UPI001C1319C4|nr:hypothetical protein [Microcoleus asticus]